MDDNIVGDLDDAAPNVEPSVDGGDYIDEVVSGNPGGYAALHQRVVTVPSFGDVTVGAATMRILYRAEKAASQAAQDDEAAAFTRAIVEGAVIEPKLTMPEIAGMRNAQLLPIIEALAEGFPDYGEQLTEENCLHWLFDAKQDWQKRISAQINNKISPVAANITRFVESFKVPAVRQDADALRGVREALERATRHLSSVRNAEALASRWDPGAVGAVFEIPEVKGLAGSPAIRNAVLDGALYASAIDSTLVHTPTFGSPEAPTFEDEEGAENSRLVRLYDTLVQLEQGLRQCIRDHMTRAGIEKWWRRRVPESVRKGCEDRWEEEGRRVDVDPLDYAYVGDLRAIIRRKDNWDEVFAAVLGKEVEVDACFAWAESGRIPIAHSRLPTDEQRVNFTFAADLLLRRIAVDSQR